MHGGQNVISYQMLETPVFNGLEGKSEDEEDQYSFIRRPMLLYLSFGTPSTGPHKHGPLLRWYYTDKDVLVESPSDFIILNHIREVYTGKQTVLLQDEIAEVSEDQHCLTLITADRALNLDIGSEETVDTWLVGLQELLIAEDLKLELITNQVPDLILPRGDPIAGPLEENNRRMFRVVEAKRDAQPSHYVAPTALALLSQGHGFTAHGFLQDVTPTTGTDGAPVPAPVFCFYSARGPEGQLDLSTAKSDRGPASAASTASAAATITTTAPPVLRHQRQQRQTAISTARGEEKTLDSHNPGGFIFWNPIPHLSESSSSRRTMAPQRTLAVADIVSVFVGCRTSGFFQSKKPTARPTHCLSVIGRLGDGEMVYLDLEAQSVVARNAWVNGLYVLLSEIGKRLRVEIPRRRLTSLNRQDSRVSLTHRSSVSSPNTHGASGWAQDHGEISLLEPSGFASSQHSGTPVAGVTYHGLKYTGNAIKYQSGSNRKFFHSARWSSMDTDNDGFVSFHARRRPEQFLGNLSGPRAPRLLVSSLTGRGRDSVISPPPSNMTAFHVLPDDPSNQEHDLNHPALSSDDTANASSSSSSSSDAHVQQQHQRGQTVGGPFGVLPESGSRASSTAPTYARARLRFLSDTGTIRGTLPSRLSFASSLSGVAAGGSSWTDDGQASGPISQRQNDRNTRLLRNFLIRGQVFLVVVDRPESGAPEAAERKEQEEEDDVSGSPKRLCLYLAENERHMNWCPAEFAHTATSPRPAPDGQLLVTQIVLGKQHPQYPSWEFDEYAAEQCASLVAPDKVLHLCSASSEVLQSFLWALGTTLNLEIESGGGRG